MTERPHSASAIHAIHARFEGVFAEAVQEVHFVRDATVQARHPPKLATLREDIRVVVMLSCPLQERVLLRSILFGSARAQRGCHHWLSLRLRAIANPFELRSRIRRGEASLRYLDADRSLRPVSARWPGNLEPLADSGEKARRYAVPLADRRHRLSRDLLVELLACHAHGVRRIIVRGGTYFPSQRETRGIHVAGHVERQTLLLLKVIRFCRASRLRHRDRRARAVRRPQLRAAAQAIITFPG